MYVYIHTQDIMHTHMYIYSHVITTVDVLAIMTDLKNEKKCSNRPG